MAPRKSGLYLVVLCCVTVLVCTGPVHARPTCSQSQLQELCKYMESGLIEPLCSVVTDQFQRVSSKVTVVGDKEGCLIGPQKNLCETMRELMPTQPMLNGVRWPCKSIKCPGFWQDCLSSPVTLDGNAPFPNQRYKLFPLPEGCDVSALPSKPLVIKTRTMSFNHKTEFVVHCGRVWYRPVGSVKASDWRLVSNDGLPKPPFDESDITKIGPILIEDDRREARKEYVQVESVDEITSDGDNLIVVGANRVVYYAKVQGFVWQGRWGLRDLASDYMDQQLGPPGWVKAPKEHRGLAIAHRGGYNEYYSDYLGHKFDQPVGVTTFYKLDHAGYDINYADPWLPTDWRYGFCANVGNRMEMLALSASCSTMMVMDTSGAVWTRFIDYDTSGNNPVFPYSLHCFEETRYDWLTSDWRPREGCSHLPGKNTRALPSEGWKSHGRPGGDSQMVASVLTIAQNGHDTAARLMRVAGKADGVLGYWEKTKLTDPDWTFKADDSIPVEPEQWVEAGAEQNTRDDVTIYLQSLKRNDVTVAITHFHPTCPPAKVMFVHESSTHTATLHYHKALRSFGATMRWEGHILMTADFEADKSPAADWLRANLVNEYRYGNEVRAYMRVAVFFTPGTARTDGKSFLRIESLGDGIVVPFTGDSIEYRVEVPIIVRHKHYIWEFSEILREEATATDASLAVVEAAVTAVADAFSGLVPVASPAEEAEEDFWSGLGSYASAVAQRFLRGEGDDGNNEVV